MNRAWQTTDTLWLNSRRKRPRVEPQRSPTRISTRCSGTIAHDVNVRESPCTQEETLRQLPQMRSSVRRNDARQPVNDVSAAAADIDTRCSATARSTRSGRPVLSVRDSCANCSSSRSSSVRANTRPPLCLASLTRSSMVSPTGSSATTSNGSPRRISRNRSRVIDRCGGAFNGVDHRTRVGRRSVAPESSASSLRCAARCQGSLSGVPNSRSPSARRIDDLMAPAKSSVRSSQSLPSSKPRSTLTWSMSIVSTLTQRCDRRLSPARLAR
jgi:hypothetical protein